LVGIYSSPKRHPKQAVAIAYKVKAKGRIKPADDAKEARWFNLDKLPKFLAFDHLEIIDDAQKLL